MGNICAKFDQNTLHGLISIMLAMLFPYLSIVTLTFDLWYQKSMRFILFVINMSARFDENAHDG